MPRAPEVFGVTFAVRAQGEWACWDAPPHAVSVLMRPDVFEYHGPAKDWFHALPGFESAAEWEPLGEGRPLGALAPGPAGMLLIDYDQKVVRGGSAMGASFSSLDLEDWKSQTRQATSRDAAWARPLIESGVCRVAHWADGVQTNLPRSVPADVRWVAGWIEQYLQKSRALDPATRLSVTLPLSPPGWDILTDVTQTKQKKGDHLAIVQSIDARYGLGAEDVARWKQWAQIEEVREVVAWASKKILDARLEAPVAPAPRRRF